MSRRGFKHGVIGFLFSLPAAAAGLAAGMALMCCFDASRALDHFARLLTGGVSSPEQWGRTLSLAAPLLMTGLSAAFAFRAGLVNLGVSGQFLAGAFCALAGAFQFRWPWWLCVLLAMAGGAAWGMIPGLLRARRGVHEALSGMLANWLALYAANVAMANMPALLSAPWRENAANQTAHLAVVHSAAALPTLGLDRALGYENVNLGLPLALLAAVCVWIVLKRTVLGCEIRALGGNREAGRWAGIDTAGRDLHVLVISGALAGLGGALYYLSANARYTFDAALPSAGFYGVAAALLAGCHPLAVIPSALFIVCLQVGGEGFAMEFAVGTADAVIAVIALASALLAWARKKTKRKWNRQSAALYNEEEET